MRRFLRSVLLLGVFLGGYYLGHLPDSPDIFGWAVSVYQRVHRVAGEICARAEQDNVGVAIMGDYEQIGEGDLVRRTGRIAEVPVGDELIGRVVNAVGQPVDGKGPINTKEFMPVERIAPGVVQRQPVKEPM